MLNAGLKVWHNNSNIPTSSNWHSRLLSKKVAGIYLNANEAPAVRLLHANDSLVNFHRIFRLWTLRTPGYIWSAFTSPHHVELKLLLFGCFPTFSSFRKANPSFKLFPEEINSRRLDVALKGHPTIIRHRVSLEIGSTSKDGLTWVGLNRIKIGKQNIYGPNRMQMVNEGDSENSQPTRQI